MLRHLAPLGASLWLMACGGGAIAPIQAPGNTQAPPGDAPSSSAATSTSTSTAKEEPLAGLVAPDDVCGALATESSGACAKGPFNELLADALTADVAHRNAALLCLERGPEAPPGVIRALRADLAPRGCADVVLGAEAAGSDVSRDVADTLVGLRVAAQLYRSVREPPLPQPPFARDAFLKHFKEVLAPWIATQAHAVDVLSKVGPRLSGYARGVVALEAGLADMRFVTVARSIELPREMKDDPEIRETYLVTLEQALEPRVARGRDAALVGLGELSRQGVLRDARLSDARHLLSTLYAGRRIDALDGLLLPALAPPSLETASLKLAALLPAYYANKLAPAPNIDDPRMLRARLEQGVPPAVWLDAAPGAASPELIGLTRRALFELGRTYFWAEPFARASSLRAPKQDSDDALVAGLSKVLSRGPRNAAALLLGPPVLPPELRDTTPIEPLAKTKGPTAGLAEFDAAYLRSLAPPADQPAFWQDQAARFARAQKLLDPQAAKVAGDLAKAASETAKELRKQLPR